VFHPFQDFKAPFQYIVGFPAPDIGHKTDAAGIVFVFSPVKPPPPAAGRQVLPLRAALVSPLIVIAHDSSLKILAVCCASAQNHIKIHESEFLYQANCIRSPKIGDFCILMQKNPQAQQAPSGPYFIPERAVIRKREVYRPFTA
jgi:hypothetical protein